MRLLCYTTCYTFDAKKKTNSVAADLKHGLPLVGDEFQLLPRGIRVKMNANPGICRLRNKGVSKARVWENGMCFFFNTLFFNLADLGRQ